MDNQGAIQLSSTTAFLEKTKHIKIKFHHVRALHLSGELEACFWAPRICAYHGARPPSTRSCFTTTARRPDRIVRQPPQQIPGRRYVTSSQFFLGQVYKLVFVPAIRYKISIPDPIHYSFVPTGPPLYVHQVNW